MTTNRETPARRRVEAVVNAVCAILLILFALLLLAGWLGWADRADAARPGPHGCRAAKHCTPPKVRPTPTVTVAPGCVEYGPDCVIDTTGTWPTLGPVVIVQSFPCPLSPPDDAEPCEPVTSTTTVAP